MIFNFVELKLKTRQEVYFILNQMNPNFIEASDLKNYNFLNIFLLQKDIESQNYRIIKNKFSKLGRINFSANDNSNNIFEHGEYLIAYHYPNNFNQSIKKLNFSYSKEELMQIPEVNRDIVLGVFSKNPSQMTIEPINQTNFEKFKNSNINYQIAVFSAIENFVRDNASSPHTKQTLVNFQDIDEKLSKKHTLINEDNLGFGYIFYKNESEGYLNEKLIFDNLENVNAYIHFQSGVIRGIYSISFSDINAQNASASGADKIERFLSKLIEPSNFYVIETPAGKGNLPKYEVDLKIAPQSRALIYFEKTNENVKISYDSRSAFTYPPLIVYKAHVNKYRFTQNLTVSNLKYEGKEVDILQFVLEYGSGVQYLYKNKTKNLAAKITLRFKNATNLYRLAESYKVIKLIEQEEENENKEKSEDENKENEKVTSYSLYTDEEKNNLKEIVIESKPKRIAFVQLETKSPFDEFSYEAEVEYLVSSSYMNK
jgi:hypothetical protein